MLKVLLYLSISYLALSLITSQTREWRAVLNDNASCKMAPNASQETINSIHCLIRSPQEITNSTRGPPRRFQQHLLPSKKVSTTPSASQVSVKKIVCTLRNYQQLPLPPKKISKAPSAPQEVSNNTLSLHRKQLQSLLSHKKISPPSFAPQEWINLTLSPPIQMWCKRWW